MLKILSLSLIIISVFISDTFSEELKAKVVREDLRVFFLDAVMHDEELFVASYDPSTKNINLWSFSTGETVIVSAAAQHFEHLSIAVIDGKIAIAYFDLLVFGYRLWIDKSGDLQPDEDEFLTVEAFTPNNRVERNIQLIEFNGRTLLVYPHLNNLTLRFWYDENNDYAAQLDEIKTVTSHNGMYPNVVVYNDKLTISYFDKDLVADSKSLSVWHDKNGNLGIDQGETIVIETSDKIKGENSMTVHDDHLAITYVIKTEGKLKLWNDTNGDFKPDDNEIQFLDHFTKSYYPSIFVYNGNLAVACKYWSYPDAHVNLWFDDGDGEISGSEMLALKSDTEGDYGNLLRLVRHKDSFKMAYTRSDLASITSDLLVAEPVQDNSTGVVKLNTNESDPVPRKSGGKKCLILENTSSCYIIVLAFLCLTLASWKQAKGTGNEKQGTSRNLFSTHNFSRIVGRNSPREPRT